MSYRKRHIKHKIHSNRPKKLFFQTAWFWFLFLALLLLGAMTYFLFFYRGLQVQNVAISGNQRIQLQALQNAAKPAVSGAKRTFLGIPLPAQNILLLPGAAIGQALKQDFPEIASVTVTKHLPQTVDIQVQERQAAGIYCDSQNACFLVDANGIAFQPAPEDHSGYFIVRQTGAADAKLGQQAVEPAMMDNATLAAQQMQNAMSIPVAEIDIESANQLDAVTQEGWKVYFATGQGSDLSAELAQLQALLGGTISADSRKKLHYIDLRFTNRAYYQ